MGGPSNTSIDEAVEDTFPASDPPSHSIPTTAGPTQQSGAGGTKTVRVWRIVGPDDVEKPFHSDGNQTEGRWTSKGAKVVYAATSPAAALLEFLAHLEGKPPEAVFLASAHFPGDLLVATSGLPSTWCNRPYQPEVQAIGDQWAESRSSFALKVPSALCVEAHNVLLNCTHVDAVHLQRGELVPVEIDARLLAAKGSHS